MPDADETGIRGRWTSSAPLTESDLAFVHRIVVDASTGVGLRYQGATPSFDEFARHAWDAVLAQWVVRSSSSGEPLGLVVIASPDFRNGYAFLSVVGHADIVGSGVMMDGVAAVLEHVFATWPFRQLYLEAAVRQLPAVRQRSRPFLRRGGLPARAAVRGQSVSGRAPAHDHPGTVEP